MSAYIKQSTINRKAVISDYGSSGVIQIVEERNLPEPQAGEVRIKVEAASLVVTDTIIRRGLYPGLPVEPPFTLGYDFVGRVDKLGAGVTSLKLGQRVADLTRVGSNATYVCRPAGNLVPVPDSLDAAEAETMILSYMTAYQMLHRIAKVQAGQKILIHGGMGSVGFALVQLARFFGLEIVTTASAKDLPLLQAYGATVLDYRAQNYRKQLRQAAGAGFDAVFDGVGMSSFRYSYRLLKSGGTLVPYGYISVSRSFEKATFISKLARPFVFKYSDIQFALWKALPNGRSVEFYEINATRLAHPDWFKEDLARLFALLEARHIEPLISKRFTMEELADGHELLQKGGVRGRFVLVMDN
jgi:NADPH:quinone reductase-like Zn-dependent oxidoreductase